MTSQHTLLEDMESVLVCCNLKQPQQLQFPSFHQWRIPPGDDVTIRIGVWSDEIQCDMFDLAAPVARLVLNWLDQSPATHTVHTWAECLSFSSPSTASIELPYLLAYPCPTRRQNYCEREICTKCENGKFYYRDPINFSSTWNEW
jgi:hypothetical protein